MAINQPAAGINVWTDAGLHNHGPEHGPKTSVPPKTCGTIVGVQQTGTFTTGPMLYAVQWATGERTFHYYNELFCIGPFSTLDEFQLAIRSAQGARLTRGPRGGFRGFSATIPVPDGTALLSYPKEQGTQFRLYVEPALEQGKVPMQTISG